MLNIRNYESKDRQEVLDHIASYCDDVIRDMDKVGNVTEGRLFYKLWDTYDDQDLKIISQMMKSIMELAESTKEMARAKQEKTFGIIEKLPGYEEE